ETKKRLILEMYNNNILEHQNQLRKFDEEIKLEKKELSQKIKEEINQYQKNIDKIHEEQRIKLRKIIADIKEKYQEKHHSNLIEKKEHLKLL
ncbi:MAG: hypothetical protein GX203_05175, partial [Acholeplasmataceae bacterium]|nr:hypothetical protein [Acholeplasmataceae bacterium]